MEEVKKDKSLVTLGYKVLATGSLLVFVDRLLFLCSKHFTLPNDMKNLLIRNPGFLFLWIGAILILEKKDDSLRRVPQIAASLLFFPFLLVVFNVPLFGITFPAFVSNFVYWGIILTMGYSFYYARESQDLHIAILMVFLLLIRGNVGNSFFYLISLINFLVISDMAWKRKEACDKELLLI